jgi:hypothetical protein
VVDERMSSVEKIKDGRRVDLRRDRASLPEVRERSADRSNVTIPKRRKGRGPIRPQNFVHYSVFSKQNAVVLPE